MAPSTTAPDLVLPDGFRFGVATAGYQVEGGFNGPGEPRNNWYGWERDGRVEPSGIAVNFWNDYEHHLDRAVAAGCDGFRMSVEWARCEPREGEMDETAFDRYRAILEACLERGLEPLVTLHHFTHPWWLGEDLWARAEAPERFAVWADTATQRLGDLVTNWVTLNEINVLAMMTYLTGDLPPGRRLAMGDLATSLDHLLTAHVLGHKAVHRHRPDAVVATNTFTFSVYELDRLLNDILLARLHGVARADLTGWLTHRRDEYHATVAAVSGRETVWRRWAARTLPLERALPRAVAAVYDSPAVCTQDVTQMDYYVPSVAAHIQLPGRRTAGGRNWEPSSMLWDDEPDPEAFTTYVKPNVAPDRPLWIVENGMCNRVHNGRSYDRLDGWTRPRYLRGYLQAMVGLIDAGVPIGAYYHWSLVDNYEWGSYQPRFGIYGIDRERGLRWKDTDSMGNDSASAYRRLIRGLRDGDRSVLAR